MKKFKRVIIMMLCAIMLSSVCGCGEQVVEEINTESDVNLKFIAMLYDNHGNNYLNVEGKKFCIYPNKVRQWGYDTSGSWVSYFDTSSVVSISIDDNWVQSCGSTVIFKDERIDIQKLDDGVGFIPTTSESSPSLEVDDEKLNDYVRLSHWWYDTHEKGQGGKKVVLIQSQDGYNIGLVEGDDVTWEVVGELPKSTLIKVDGKKLYLHRCNFTIIDTALFDKVVDE